MNVEELFAPLREVEPTEQEHAELDRRLRAPAPAPVKTRRRRVPLRILVLPAFGALAAAVIVLAGLFSDDANQPRLSPLQVAAASAAGGAPATGRWHYIKVRTHTDGLARMHMRGVLGQARYTDDGAYEMWTSASRVIINELPNTVRAQPVDPSNPNDVQTARWQRDGSHVKSHIGSNALEGAVGDVPIAQLPTDPAKLLALVRSQRRHPGLPVQRASYGASLLLLNLFELLTYYNTPPKVRSALFGALALVPGVKPITAPRGSAVAWPDPTGSLRLDFDPKTASVIAFSRIEKGPESARTVNTVLVNRVLANLPPEIEQRAADEVRSRHR